MAQAADEAMSYSSFEGENANARKVDCLKKIGEEILGRSVLPTGTPENDALWKKVAMQFQTHKWPSETAPKKDAGPDPLGRPGSKKEGGKKDEPAAPKEGKRPAPPARALAPSSGWVGVIAVGLIVLVMIGVVWVGYMWSTGKLGVQKKSKSTEKKTKRPKVQAMLDRQEFGRPVCYEDLLARAFVASRDTDTLARRSRS